MHHLRHAEIGRNEILGCTDAGRVPGDVGWIDAGGTGKTHIALGLGLAACQKRLSVGFTTAAALVHELMEARDDKQLLRFQKRLASYKLLIIDELGFVPLSKTGAELLFEVFQPALRAWLDPGHLQLALR